MSFLVGDDWIDAPAGTFIRVPAGMTHDFRNRSRRAAPPRSTSSSRADSRPPSRPGLSPVRPLAMRTYVRVAARDPHRGAPARRRRAQRLRDLPPARSRPHHGPRLAQAPLRARSAVARVRAAASDHAGSSSSRRTTPSCSASTSATATSRSSRGRIGSVSSSTPRTRRSSTSPRRLLRAVFPANRVGRVLADDGATVVLWAYSTPPDVPVPAARRRARSTSARSSSRTGSRSSSTRRRGRSCAAASAPTAASSSTGPAATSTSATTSRTSRRTSSTCSSATCAAVGLRPRRYAGRIRLNRREDVARLRRARRPQVLSATRYALRRSAAVAELVDARRSGRRELYARGGSSPLSRMASLPCEVGSCRYRLGD